MSDDQKKEKWARLREIILNIIGEKENNKTLRRYDVGVPIETSEQKQENIKTINNQQLTDNDETQKREIIKEEKKSKVKKIKFKYILMIFIFLIIGFLIILGIGLYKYNWDNKQIIKITNIIPYPAIIINNKETKSFKIIKYSEFQENFQAIKLFFQKQKQIDLNFQILSNNILKENTLEMMIEDYFIFEALKKNKIIIKQEEIDNKIQSIINQVGSLENLKKIIKNLYNWDLEKFKNKAIKQMISQEKIENLIAPENLKDWIEEEHKKVKIYRLI
ncbi:hypothetical protein HY750_02875 [Candidatus Kuenenbacteria bacterium]|nr:hypothetical protein [Candidatus Kuenenbacteria bacterium]